MSGLAGVWHFASRDVGFGSFEKCFSEDLLASGDRGGRWEGLECLFYCRFEGRPVGLPVVDEASGAGFGGWTGEPAVEADDDREMVRVESCHGIPPRACGEMGTGYGDIW